MKNKLIKFTTLVLLSLITLPVLAEVWDNPHKYFDKKTNKWVVYFPTTTRATRVREFDHDFIANDCGWVTFPIGGEDRRISSIKIGFDQVERIGSESNITTRPTCTKQKDGTFKSNYSASFGTLFKSSVSYHYLAEPGAPINIKIGREIPIYRKGTQCGFILFGVSDKRKLTTFTVNGTKYNFDDLVEVKHPRICFKGVGNEWVLYTPDNF